MSLSPRTRLTAVAVGLGLSLSLAAAPAVLAQEDDPTSAVQALVDTLAAGEFAAVEGLFCEAFRSEADALSFSEMAASLPPGVDPEVVIGAIGVQPTIATLETVSQSDLEAVVRVVGSLALTVDVEALEPLIVALLEASGQEVTEDMVEMVSGMMAGQFSAESLEIDEEISVARADAASPWLLCDTIGSEEEVMTDPSASADPGANVEPETSIEPLAEDGSDDE